jgi:hypothetical protein
LVVFDDFWTSCCPSVAPAPTAVGLPSDGSEAEHDLLDVDEALVE